MKKNKSIIFAVVIILVIVGMVVYQGNQKNGPGTIKVGVIAPLSGQYGAIGESIRDAVILATEGDETIEVVFEDGQFDPKIAVSAYQKLKNVDNVDVILNVVSPSMSAIQSLVDEDEILTFHLTESDYKADDSTFQLMPFSFPIFSVIGKEATDRYDRIALVYGDIDIFKTNSEFFKKSVPPEEIVHEAKLSANSDLRTEVSKILASNPDSVTVIVDKETGIKLIKTLSEQKGDRDIDIICDANLEFVVGDYIDALGGSELLEGCISANLPDLATEEFKSSFKDKFGYDPMIASDYAYDAITIIKDLRNVSREDWTKTVQETDMSGVSGPIAFDENGTRFAASELHIFQDGKFIKLEN